MMEIADRLLSIWLAVAVHLWQSTLVLLPLFLLARWLRSAPAGLSYMLWSAALLKLLLPMSLCGRLAGALGSLLPAGLRGAVGAGAGATLETVSPILDPRVALDASRAGPGAALAVLVLAGSAIWLGGALWGLVRLARDHATAASTGAVPVTGLEGERRLRLGRALAGVRIPPERILICEGSALPRVAGLLRPRILIPATLLDTLASEELRAVLLHEDAHRRRRDPLRATGQRLLAALLFFYPLVRPLIRRLQQAAELICDESVLRAGVGAGVYSLALARTVQSCLLPPPGAAEISPGGGSFLRLRLERLSTSWRMKAMPIHRIILGLALLFLAAGTFLPLQLSAADDGAKRDSEPSSLAASAGDAAKSDNESSAVAEDSADLVEFDVPPKVLKTVPVEYPEAAREAEAEGTVNVKVFVAVDGGIGEIEVVQEAEGHPELTEAALASISKWVFEPATKDGKPVAATISIPIKFKLRGEKNTDAKKDD